MEKKVYLISAFGAIGFLYLGFRYGMYANEGCPLPYRENLVQMLAWGLSHCLIMFTLSSATLLWAFHDRHNYQARLFLCIITEVLGIGIVSGLFIIRGLIVDPWYLSTLLLFSFVTALVAVLYFSNLQARERDHHPKTPRLLDRLKLEHKKYLQFVNTMSWIIVFSLFGYLTTIFFSPAYDIQTFPVDSRLRLFVVNVIGLAYLIIGITFGALWQLIKRLEQIEDRIVSSVR